MRPDLRKNIVAYPLSLDYKKNLKMFAIAFHGFERSWNCFFDWSLCPHALHPSEMMKYHFLYHLSW